MQETIREATSHPECSCKTKYDLGLLYEQLLLDSKESNYSASILP